MSAFFYKLIPPRPTFPADISPAELAQMRLHSAYWRGQVEQGVGVVAGPVMDPKGAFGIGVLKAADQAAAAAVINADPILAPGFGFSFELHPMGSAIHRD